MTRGLTLIELVVAMSVFALVAVMGLQALTGSLTMRDRLTARADTTDALGQGVALLRNDLSAALPMVFFPPEKARPASALRRVRKGQGFSLSVGGQTGLPLAAGGMDAAREQRVDWWLDTDGQRLIRQAWPTLYPARAAQQGPEVAALEGVTGMSLRSFWPGKGWVPGLRPEGGGQTSGSSAPADGDQAGTVPETYSSTLPHAVEITLQTRDHGALVLVEYLQ